MIKLMEIALSLFSNFCGLHQIEMTANLPDSRSELRRTFRDSRSHPRNIQDSIPIFKSDSVSSVN